MKIKCTLLLLLTIMLFSCKSTGFMMGKAKVTMLIDVSYPAKAETEDIDVYSTKKPAKDYVEFALVKCADTNNEWCIKQIKAKAREIGADGIIITGAAASEGIGVPMGNISYITSNTPYGLSAVAIKYKE